MARKVGGKVYSVAPLPILVPDGMAGCVDPPSHCGIQVYGFEPWSRQFNDLNIDICHVLARHFTLLGHGKDRLA